MRRHVPSRHHVVKVEGFYYFKSSLMFLSELKEKFALVMDKSHKASGRLDLIRETGLSVLWQHDQNFLDF